MKYDLLHNGDVKFYKEGKLFLLVRRGGFFVFKSRFFKDGDLVLRTSTAHIFLYKSVKIHFQKMADPIAITKWNGRFTLFQNGNSYLVDFRSPLFKKLRLRLFLNEQERGEIASKYIFQTGDYTMTTDCSEDEDLNFMFLFASQLLNPV